MSNREIIKSYSAEGTISPCRLVKPGAADYGVVVATAGADKVIGVTMPLVSVVSGDSVEIMHEGIADLQLGGTVTRGDLLMSDGTGQGIVAAAGAGANVRTIGTALVSGVSGDIIPVLLSPGSFQG